MAAARRKSRRDTSGEGTSGVLAFRGSHSVLVCVRSDESPRVFPEDLFLCRHKLLIDGFFLLFYFILFSLYGKQAIDGLPSFDGETSSTYHYAAGRKIAEIKYVLTAASNYKG